MSTYILLYVCQSAIFCPRYSRKTSFVWKVRAILVIRNKRFTNTESECDMQIRVRGNQTEFLRAIYDPASKRTKQKLIKEIDFTPGEKIQFEAWRQGKNTTKQREKMMYDGLNAAQSVSDLAKAVEAEFHVNEPEALLAALDRLNAALRKRGITRPAKAKATPVKPV